MIDGFVSLSGRKVLLRPFEQSDITPEYVAWFKTHATAEEIAVRYPDNRRVPASTAEFAAAQERLQGRLKGEKKDTGKENDFTDKAE